MHLSLCSIEDILAETDSDEDEDEKPKKGQKKLVKKKGQAWLKEGISDEPLNFLDPKVSQRVLGKRPIQPLDLMVDHCNQYGLNILVLYQMVI